MRTSHPHTQPGRLATLDTGAGTSGRNEAEEETDEIYETKKELDEVDEETVEPKNGAKQVTVGRQSNSDLTKFLLKLKSRKPKPSSSLNVLQCCEECFVTSGMLN